MMLWAATNRSVMSMGQSEMALLMQSQLVVNLTNNAVILIPLLYQLVQTICCKGLAPSLACLWQFIWDIVKTNMFESVTWPQPVCWASITSHQCHHTQLSQSDSCVNINPGGGPGGRVPLQYNICVWTCIILHQVYCHSARQYLHARLQLTSVRPGQLGAVKQLSKLKTIFSKIPLTDIRTNKHVHKSDNIKLVPILLFHWLVFL